MSWSLKTHIQNRTVVWHTSAHMMSVFVRSASLSLPSSVVHSHCLVWSGRHYSHKHLLCPLRPQCYNAAESRCKLFHCLWSALLLSSVPREAGWMWRGVAQVRTPSVQGCGPLPVHSWMPAPLQRTQFQLLSRVHTVPHSPQLKLRWFEMDELDPLLYRPEHSLLLWLCWQTEPGTRCCWVYNVGPKRPSDVE